MAASPQGPAELPARELVARLPARAWRRLSAGDGAKGPRVYDWARVALTRPGWPGRGFWLLARRRLSDGELAFYACFGPARITLAELVRVAGTRWAVEECFQAAKDQVGLDHYQVRRFDAWYRHVTLVLVAQGFLAAVRAHAAPTARAGTGGRLSAQKLPQPPGSDLVRVSTAEARRLLAALVWWTPPTVRQVLWWSWWRRRHQARARCCHWRRRQQRLAGLTAA
jgi:hypothetical protein